MKKAAAIAARMISRVTVFSTSIAFVIHVYADHAHQTIARTSVARAKPRRLVSSRISAVTCVKTKTKTRSKKSSR